MAKFLKVVLALTLLVPIVANGAWYWPFDSESDTNAPPRLHRLLEKANDYIELAQDSSASGDADKALDYYRQALDELARVAMENPDRVNKPEFAPLRNKEATCRAAIDTIRFEQINANVRAVTITDVDELRRKWRRKHGLELPEDRAAEKKKEAAERVKDDTMEAAKTPEVKTPPKVEKPAEKTVVKDARSVEKKPDPEDAEQSRPKGIEELVAANKAKTLPKSGDWNGRIRYAVELLKNKDYATADVYLEGMMNERPNDLTVLLLRAAGQAGSGAKYAARRTLERAMRAHPKSHLPYYNLANLALDLGEGVESAKQYYELGRMVGGPANELIEKRLK